VVRLEQTLGIQAEPLDPTYKAAQAMAGAAVVVADIMVVVVAVAALVSMRTVVAAAPPIQRMRPSL
jgi:hypothetical protein